MNAPPTDATPRDPSAAPTAPPASPAKVKPRLRGVSHEIAFYFAIAGTIALTMAAEPGLKTTAALIYGLSIVTLFGTSALYHRPMWSPVARARLRKADHAAIFVLIAGSYAPLGLVALPPDAGMRLLAFAWGGCALGLLKALFWAHAPRWVTAASYILVGWAAAVEWTAMGQALGSTRAGLIGLGGVCYSVGAIVYARKRPDPVPHVFGYHEIFHALVILAAFIHFAALGSVVLGGGAP
jgi:hemolysin III